MSVAVIPPSLEIPGEEPRTPAGRRILDAAGELFYAVGVDRIAEVAGTTKKTLYDRFGSKEALVVAYLRRRHARFVAHVGATVEAAQPGVDPVLAVFDALADWLDGNARGCGFINAFAELAGTGHAGLAVVEEEKRWVHALFVALLHARPGLDGAEADRMARLLALLYEGAIVRSTAGHDASAAPLARELAASPAPSPPGAA